MKNPLQLAINAVLFIAVAVLFYLHFSSTKAPKVAKATAPTAVVAADSAAAPVAEEETVVTESADTAAAEVAAAPAVAGEKIAYIESGRLLDGYQGMKDARRSFEAKAKGWERQNQALISSFRTAVEAYQKQAPGMSAEQRAAAEEKLQAQQQESGMQQEKIGRQAQEEEAKLTQTVLESVNKKVEAYGKANGYKLILIAAPSGTIAYGRKDMDITVPVLAYLNGQYRKR
ncbi:OmpH family outer membrane protein [Hymenobacter sp. ASUV-10]|uniref:OmpH family outer membrane protein n=1 Tax=Hymenobacter aranciens TaxID=3063996 RepID=A0ABT9BGA5_9BACT|nr:OmpH family outer membrane protein [Hymenobacter sp. ASUV-10]MDO7877292.1 OmpH family outer membrane protein [Hymenobacter sp. ASUV-10]